MRLVQEAVKSGHDGVQQPGYLPLGGRLPRAGRTWEQKASHEGGISSAAASSAFAVLRQSRSAPLALYGSPPRGQPHLHRQRLATLRSAVEMEAPACIAGQQQQWPRERGGDAEGCE